MMITFKVMLIIIMIISFIGTVGDDCEERILSLASICIASIVAFIVSVMWL